MSSILTNTGAMVALQSLKSINQNLLKTQDEISTGKSVATAKDNSAIWAISKVMESDVAGFKAISQTLALGESTVTVAREAAESVTDLLTQMKEKIVSSQEENVDRDTIQKDITALSEQITNITGAAQFNGLNLLSNRETEAGTGSIDILSSLDRNGSGVTSSDINVRKQDLGSQQAEIDYTGTVVTAATDDIAVGGTAAQVATAVAGAATPNTTDVDIASAGSDAIEAGAGFQIMITASGGAAAGIDSADGDIIYVARDGDTAADVAKGLADSFNKHIKATLGDNNNTIAAVANGNSVEITGYTGAAGDTLSINAEQYGAADTTIGGGLAAMANIDVTTAAGTESALEEIEGLIQTSINAAASFGSSQGRIETQSDFVSGMTDALKAGIGSLVDANMEETSARLQALQVQQQLGVQAMSIANQAPQSILSLFR
ncbi:flagellin [Oceaniglobus ichthyenteri]|uniref:flagellin n=1 Tax=Oceaniglobus ichthyenteri TaxID=2136177 RepID=UPI000D352732|nr:flagellin [Oceaniglobus ichthyenteri]